MRKTTSMVLAALALTTLSVPLFAQKAKGEKAVTEAAAKNVAGVWKGTLGVSGIQLRLVVTLTQGKDGALTGDLESPDQGPGKTALSGGKIKGDKVKIELSSIRGVFEGKLSADGQTIDGTWTQVAPLPLTLKRTTAEAVAQELDRPQTPKKPYPYLEEEVSYENKDAKVKLAGTLTLPKGSGPFPVALLITGSGAQDRNESLMAHQPFLVLADHLTRQGIAVLRVDDRGVGKSTGNFAEATTADFVTDVLAGVEYLKTRKEIDPKHIGLIGHSEGGLIAPAVAVKSKDVAFIVLMAGTGLPGSDILTMQSELIAKAAGALDNARAINRKLMEQVFVVVREEKDNEKALTKIKAVWDKVKSEAEPVLKAQLDAVDATIVPQFRPFLSPWMRYFLDYDPRAALKQVACPVLAINGELDLQVPPKEDLAEIEAALKAGGNPDYSIVLLPKLNHLFQTAKTGSPQEYGQIKETMAPLALKTMSDWILKHTGQR